MMTIGTRFTWNNYPAMLKSPVMEVRNISDLPCQYLIRNTSDNSEKWMSQWEVNKLANVLSPEKALAHMEEGGRNQETSYVENNSQSARDRVQAFKTYAKCNKA